MIAEDPLKITFGYKTGFTDDITFCGEEQI